MTLQTVAPEVPRRLPHARLFLDDLQQIANLFAELNTAVTGNAAPPAVEFRAENQETTEIEDLPKIGAQTNNLSLTHYSKGVFLVFEVQPWGIRWWSNGLPSPLAWQTHHQLEEILNRRPPRILDMLTIRGPQQTATLVGLLCGLALGATSTKAIPAHTPRRLALGVAAALVAAGFSFQYFTRRLVGPSVAVLDYSYKHSERRRERNSKLLFTLLGWLLGVISGVFLLKLKH